jgi:iron complex transport system substrate-binding protein
VHINNLYVVICKGASSSTNNKKERQLKEMARIVSFLPSSTEILYKLGLGDQIVGVTHECKYPEDAKTKPRIVNSSFDAAKLNSTDIDRKIAEIMKTGGDIYLIDDKMLKQARPDLIIAQGVCEVCAPFTKEIDRAVSVLGYKPDILVLDPHDLDDILISIMDIAERVSRIKEGRRLVASLQKRIDNIRTRAASHRMNSISKEPRSTVLCIEWIDPFYSAGHWIPQMVEIAGGVNRISSRGSPSRRISIDEIIDCQPDKIVLMPCGFDVDRTLREARILGNNERWKNLEAVQRNEVYAVNANEYFSKPGPRTITGLEILAKIIDPASFGDFDVPSNSFERMT